MKTRQIIYDQITITILADHDLDADKRTELLKALRLLPSKLEHIINNELLEESLRKQIRARAN
jgi:hypothetical protein